MKALVITEASRGIGLGHLIRSAVAGFALKVGLNAKVQLIIKGDNIEHSILTRLKSQWTPNFNTSQEFLNRQISLSLTFNGSIRMSACY